MPRTAPGLARAALLVAAAASGACRRDPPAAPPNGVTPAPHDAGAPVVAAVDVAPAPPPGPPADAGPPPEITVRVVNASQQPLAMMTNPDTNEMLHTRKLFSRRAIAAAAGDGGERPAGPSADGELVKFFPVGQMPMCSSDAGAGYGGLGQPGRRTLAPGEAMEFAWDGRLRREVLDPQRGVCQQEQAPDPGRYRFEFDQPYNAPVCNRPVFTLPLAPDAPRVIEIRCTPRPPTRE